MLSNLTIYQIVDFLSNVEGFCELNQNDLVTLVAPLVGIESFERDQLLIQYGSIGTMMFVVYEGQARVDVPDEEGAILSFPCAVGSLCGEMSLVSNKPRMANVVAETRVVALTLDIESFRMLMTVDWKITRAFAGLIGRRLSRVADKTKGFVGRSVLRVKCSN
ncbi:MAG: cyclic nucleotide-binding domain-containing protein [Magnetococcales bacterium]|nr:cyclic nucleotide-binding domain-containing protein [Magnetococcales bacterium]MBF0437730.1 cyclic nucleotide-binding domain-containing protein [Magnetococcales bacterium]